MATTKTYWVVCDDYAAGPYTREQAERKLATQPNGSVCGSHRIVPSHVKPIPAHEARILRAAWDEPWQGDPAGDDANDERMARTVDLAAAILAQDCGTRIGDLTIVTCGWSKDTAARADATANSADDLDAWTAALGCHEHATLTGDGKPAYREQWCGCGTDLGSWVRYEHWTADGMVAHGYVHESCRGLLQTG